MTKNEKDVLNRIGLTPEVTCFLEKGEYKAKNLYYRPGGQLPLSARDRIKRSLTTGSSSLSKDGRNTLGKVKTSVGLVGTIGTIGVAKFHPTAALATALVAGGATSVSQIIDGAIQRDDKSQADVVVNNLILKNSHEKARSMYTPIKDLNLLKKIEQITGSMVTRLADWINYVEYERQYENDYNNIMLRAKKEGLSPHNNPELFNYIKSMRQPDYELLNSAKGLSIEKIEEDLIKLEGSNLAAHCVIAEHENNFWAPLGTGHTGRVLDVDEKIVLQEFKCGYSGKNDVIIIKYHRDDILNVDELKKGDIYTIYRDQNGKATAERIDDISLENDQNRCIVELRGR